MTNGRSSIYLTLMTEDAPQRDYSLREVFLQVFVTPNCPCAVALAHRLAYASSPITADTAR